MQLREADVLQAWVDREVSQVQARLPDVLGSEADPIEVPSAYVDRRGRTSPDHRPVGRSFTHAR